MTLTRVQIAGRIAAAAFFLGLLGTLLFCDAHGALLGSAGASLLVWIALGVAALLYLAGRGQISLDADGKWLALPACFFAATFLWREDGFLQFWNAVLMLFALLLMLTRCRGPWRVALAGYTEYLRLAFLGALSVIGGPFALGGDLLPKQPLPAADPLTQEAGEATQQPRSAVRGFARFFPSLVRGVILSVIPLCVFSALFASADPVFDRLLRTFFDWNFADIITRIAWLLVFAFFASGALRTALLREPLPDQSEPKEGSPAGLLLRTIKSGDVVVALVLIDLLFALFVAVQFRFLFGGDSIVRSVPGLNYSTYARGGFFELAWVAGLALPVLLISHWMPRNDSGMGQRRIKWLTGILTALLFVIVASAFKRMALYEEMWGLTEKRMLVSVFIGAITLVFAWFLATVWRNQPRRFAFGLLVASMLTIASLDIVNTDALVISVDSARAQGLRYFDACYLAGLGADAVPSLAANIGRLKPDQQPLLAKVLVDNWGKPGTSDWRQWNASDSAARRAVAVHRTELAALAAKAPKEGS